VNHCKGDREGKFEVLWRKDPFVKQDDARREADVDQQVEVGQHKLPADHLRRAAAALPRRPAPKSVLGGRGNWPSGK